MKWKASISYKPICFKKGWWDGKQSEIVLACDVDGNIFLAQCYEGEIDGNRFYEWYRIDTISKNEWLVENVSMWLTIPD